VIKLTTIVKGDILPIYEFVCQQCQAKSSLFIKSIGTAYNHKCPSCNSSDVIRAPSTFSYHRSIQSIHENAGEPRLSPGPDYYKDPRNIGRSTEKRFKDLGIEMPEQMKESIKSYREGELPKPMKEALDKA
jgi:putative FmdB family regulatory protein